MQAISSLQYLEIDLLYNDLGDSYVQKFVDDFQDE